LVDAITPTVSELTKAWQPLKNQMQKVFESTHKPILFTEYGYLSVDKCCYKNWEAENDIGKLKINQQAQANGLEALYKVFSKEKWWSGGFLWKWFPEMLGHEGYPEKDYTPQGKISERIVKNWFNQ
jgi:hypothetical protein